MLRAEGWQTALETHRARGEARGVPRHGGHTGGIQLRHGLICHDLTGKELWKYPLPIAETSGGFGTGNSPTLAGNVVLLNRDMLKGCSLLAVDLQTGKKLWETARPDVGPSFGSTMVWKNNGKDEVVMSGSLKLKAYDLKTGKENWSLAGLPSFTCTTAVEGDGMIFFAGWSPGKGDSQMPTFAQMAAEMDKNKDGAITPEETKARGSRRSSARRTSMATASSRRKMPTP